MNTSVQIERESQKNLDRLESEIDQQRAKVSNLIDALGSEFSIGQLVERAVGTTKGGSMEFAQNLGHTVQANPIPSLLTSAGLLWLYVSRNNHPARPGAQAGGDDSMGGAMGGGLADMKERLSDGVDQAKDSLQAVGSRASDGLSHAGDAIHDQGQRISQKFNQMLEDNPLVLGAVGLALGALLGALVPKTEQEDRLFGDVSDKVTGKVKDMAQSAVEQARDSLDPDSSAT